MTVHHGMMRDPYRRMCRLPCIHLSCDLHRDASRSYNSAGRRWAGKPGLTLIELLVVLVVLALLVGLVAPQIFGRIGEARTTTTATQIKLLETALDSYRLDAGIYPSSEQGLGALRERPTRPPLPMAWRGPYLRDAIPNDPWGRSYLYRAEGAGNAFGLYSLGKDGKEGGEGDDADVGRKSGR